MQLVMVHSPENAHLFLNIKTYERVHTKLKPQENVTGPQNHDSSINSELQKKTGAT